jgi:hypothetical protein
MERFWFAQRKASVASPKNLDDARLFELVHRLVAPVKAGGRTERRTRRREPFGTVQRIAPRHGAALPQAADFFAVQCRDLTQAGFSFLLAGRPQFKALVAVLGTPPDEIYLAALVRHCADVLVHPSGAVERIPRGRLNAASRVPKGVRRMVQVGCRFTGRLRKPR